VAMLVGSGGTKFFHSASETSLGSLRRCLGWLARCFACLVIVVGATNCGGLHSSVNKLSTTDNRRVCWVAVGSGIWSSSDGVKWVKRLASDSTIESVATDGHQWLVVGGTADRISGDPGLIGGVVLYRITDGRSWHAERLPSRDAKAIAWTGRRWVVVGRANDVLVSDDGFNWAAPASGARFSGTTIASHGHVIVVADGSEIAVSRDDGATWRQPAPQQFNSRLINYRLGDVVWDGTRWLATGDDKHSSGPGMVLWSDDGLNWSAVFADPQGASISGAIAVHNGLRIIAGDPIWRSADGREWTKGPANVAEGNGALATDGHRWVIVDTDVTTSVDAGRTWTRVAKLSAPDYNGARSVAAACPATATAPTSTSTSTPPQP
jgi:hypothetical protein